MRVKVEVELGRPARRTVGLLLALLLLFVPAVALANHRFPDVLNSNPFHDDIDAIADVGITTGFQDGGFHPSDPVTRQAMSAFLNRGLGRIARRESGPTDNAALIVPANVETTSWTTVRTMAITAPGQDSQFEPLQWAYVEGKVAFNTAMNSSEGCPCEFGAFLSYDADELTGPWQYQTFYSTSSEPFAYSFTVDAFMPVQPGPVTFQLHVFLNDRANTVPSATFEIDQSSSITVLTFPFRAGI